MRETPPTADVIDFDQATGRFVDPADWDTDPPSKATGTIWARCGS